MEAGNDTVVDNFKPKGRSDKIAVAVEVKRHTHALRVHGDSMVSEAVDSFPEGSVIVVEPEMPPWPGNCVIVLNRANETTFKSLLEHGGDFCLKPLNTRYPIKPLGNAKVIGVVREFTPRFR